MPEISTEKKEEQPVEVIDNSKKIKTLIYVGIVILALLLLIILIVLLFYYFYPSSENSYSKSEVISQTPITTSTTSSITNLSSSTPQAPITTSSISSITNSLSSKPNSFSSSILTSIPELTYVQRPAINQIINKQQITQPPKIADNSYNKKILSRNKYMESLFKNGGAAGYIKRFKRFCK